MKRNLIILWGLAAWIFLLVTAGIAQGRTITVGYGGDYDFNTIQVAIEDANNGDTIIVSEGTYYENINFKGKNITLRSTDPNNPDAVSATIIDGQQKGSVVTFLGIEDSNCVLSGFTITGGYTDGQGGGICGNGMTAGINNCNIARNSAYRRGGGLFDCDGSITYCTITKNIITASPATTEGAGLHSCDGLISNCTISDNISSSSFLGSGFGGGLYKCHGQIVNCTISGNVAGSRGGGLYDCDGSITDCTIIGNKAEYSRGGGLYRCDGNISRCIIRDNLAGESGGGFYDCRGQITNCLISTNKALDRRGGGLSSCKSISNCVITFNSANKDGGGLYGFDSTSINNCIISGNSADANGGGLYVEGYGSINNCIISGNSANSGGGLYGYVWPSMPHYNYKVTAVNCTISGNRASKGSGFYCKGGNSTVTNSILWNNKAAEANEIYLDFYIIYSEFGTPFKVPSSVTVMYSDVQGGAAGIHIESDCTLTWATGNIDADPCFADPNNEDYHLKSQAGRWDANEGRWTKDEVTSLCIDASDPASPIGLEPFPNGGIINMGGYGGTAEASKSYFGEPLCETIVAGDINGDCIVNLKDFAFMAFHWLEER